MKTQYNSLPNFESLVSAYYRPLLKFAVSLCGDLEIALNLTQHTFCLALRRREVLGKRKTKQWLFTILFSEFLKKQLAARAGRARCRQKLTRSPYARHTLLPQPVA